MQDIKNEKDFRKQSHLLQMTESIYSYQGVADTWVYSQIAHLPLHISQHGIFPLGLCSSDIIFA